VADRTLEEWRDCLLKILEGRQSDIARRRNYYRGKHAFPTAPNTATDDFRRLSELAVTNMMALVVDTVNERLTPRDVRLSDDDDVNLAAWRDVWQRNQLDSDCRINHEEALKVGRGFVLVWPTEDEDRVSITIEDPADVVVAYRPGSRRKRVAALKRWCDVPDSKPGENQCITVWTDSAVKTWRRDKPTVAWAEYGDDYGTGPNPMGVVPIVEFLCKPSVTGMPAPEISDSAIVLQDRINKTGFDAVVAGEYGAFPQRYAIGIEVEMEFVTVNGEQVPKPKNPLTVGPNRVWALKNAEQGQNGTIGQLEAFGTEDLLKQIDAWIRQLSSTTQTPVYHMMAGGDNIGAEFIERLEASQIAKIKAHQVTFGESWEEVFRLALPLLGMDAPADIELGWMPAEQSTPTEQADQLSKMNAADLPMEYALRKLGETPSEIERLTANGGGATPRELAEIVQKAYLGVGVVITADEARDMLRRAGAELNGSLAADAPAPLEPVLA
jgi:hypothetical protein